jgi:hypothetical protein
VCFVVVVVVVVDGLFLFASATFCFSPVVMIAVCETSSLDL